MPNQDDFQNHPDLKHYNKHQKKMELSNKIANIKEKIAQLASKMENLRLAVLREQLLVKSPKAVIKEE